MLLNEVHSFQKFTLSLLWSFSKDILALINIYNFLKKQLAEVSFQTVYCVHPVSSQLHKVKVVLLVNRTLCVSYIIIETVFLHNFLIETNMYIELFISSRLCNLSSLPKRRVDFVTFLSWYFGPGKDRAVSQKKRLGYGFCGPARQAVGK